MILETDHGRFEAETECEVMRMARKAKRETERKEKLQAACREKAQRCAHENGFRVYDRFLEEKEFPRGWECRKPGAKYFPPQRKDEFGIYTLTQVEGDHGRGWLELYDRSWRLVALAENGAGMAMVAFIEDVNTGKVQASAVGVYEDQVALAPLAPCITMELFRQVD